MTKFAILYLYYKKIIEFLHFTTKKKKTLLILQIIFLPILLLNLFLIIISI